MSAPTLARLRSLYPALTGAEQRVAAAILEQPAALRDWSGRDLARHGGTTETVVFRLAHKLGLEGFKALKMAVLEEQAAERARLELGVFNIPIHHHAPVEVQAQDVLQAYVDSLQRTAALVDPARIAQVAQVLREAGLVTLLGMGSSQAAASLAENILLRCGIPCRLAHDAHVQLLQTLQQPAAHVALAFSYSGETQETAGALETARARGARTVAVTAFEHSSLTRQADIVLMVPVINPHPYRVGLVDAVLPYLLLLDLLAIQITASDAPGAAALRDAVERTMQQRKLRESPAPPGG